MTSRIFHDIIRRESIDSNLPDVSASQAKEMLDRIVKLAGFDLYCVYSNDMVMCKNDEKCPVIASESPEGITFDWFEMAECSAYHLKYKKVLQTMEELSMAGMNIMVIDLSTHVHDRYMLWPAFHTFDMMTIWLDMKDIDA